MVKLLEDSDTYSTLPSNPIFIEKRVGTGCPFRTEKDIINKKEARYLITEACRTPIIYALPKIHKDNTNPPLRPIVNGIESITARIG